MTGGLTHLKSENINSYLPLHTHLASIIHKEISFDILLYLLNKYLLSAYSRQHGWGVGIENQAHTPAPAKKSLWEQLMLIFEGKLPWAVSLIGWGAHAPSFSINVL